MKEYEKLAEELVEEIRKDTFPFVISEHHYDGLRKGYLAGFLKAREMAKDTMRLHWDIDNSKPNCWEALNTLGEENL